MTDPVYVFVYGTLLHGQENDGYLAGLRRWPGTTLGRLFHVPAGYPALVPDADGRVIRGEVVRLDSAARLGVLDLFEGVPQGLYVRRQIDVLSMDRPGRAWAWVVDERTARLRRYRPLDADDWRALSGWKGSKKNAQ
jgi:gamma-glutamylcyclotransferase (GGCT)/AIG2-like uncharacterized protein YtfP